MMTVFVSHARQDKQVVQDLADFLERGARVRVFRQEGEIGPLSNLIAKTEEGRMADVILVVLSPDSAPPRWVREEWTAAFLDGPKQAGVELATLLLRACRFPEVLRRRNFFDLTGDRLEGLRAVKQWVLELKRPVNAPQFRPAPQNFHGGGEHLEELRRSLSDEHGFAVVSGGRGKTTLALEFILRYRGDFEAVLWLRCGQRSPAALAGDLSSQLGLRLDGEADANVRKILEALAEWRCLLVLDHVEDEKALDLAAGGRSSTLITTRRTDLWCGEGLRVDWPAPPVVGELRVEEQRLLAAMAACAAGEARLPLAAEVSGVSTQWAQGLIERGLVRSLDEERYEVLAEVGHALRAEHARAVLRGEDIVNLQWALGWALAQGGAQWPAARQLARRAFSLLMARDRLAEAFETMEELARAAEQHGDRQVLADCAWERSWILEKWDRPVEAQALHHVRRLEFEDQMQFDFGA